MFWSKIKNYDGTKLPKSNWGVNKDGLYFSETRKCNRLEEILSEKVIETEKAIEKHSACKKFIGKYGLAIKLGGLVVGAVFLDRFYPDQTNVGIAGAAIGMMMGFGIGSSCPDKMAKMAGTGALIGFVAGFAYEQHHITQQKAETGINHVFNLKTAPVDRFKQTMAEAVAMKANTVAYPGTLKPV